MGAAGQCTRLHDVLAGRHGNYILPFGYDDDVRVCPEPVGAQRKPDGAPTCGELANIYIVTGKRSPEVGLEDGLERVVSVMASNRETTVWETYISRFDYWDELTNADIDEIRRRVKRASAWSMAAAPYFPALSAPVNLILRSQR